MSQVKTAAKSIIIASKKETVSTGYPIAEADDTIEKPSKSKYAAKKDKPVKKKWDNDFGLPWANMTKEQQNARRKEMRRHSLASR
mgnify:CR=1 FL=1|jgi:hypothetical protein